ncbi:MAG TPA: hypothetical protein VF924_10725, partial [Stellaceae bacterium]
RGLDPRIHAFVSGAQKGVDARAKSGQDEVSRPTSSLLYGRKNLPDSPMPFRGNHRLGRPVLKLRLDHW